MLIWFIHVPRTGGMSLAKYLNNIRNKNVIIRHRGHEKFSKNTLRNLQSKYDNVVTCTIIRNPAEHSMSLWTYMQKHKKHYYHKKASHQDFITWARNFKEFPYYVKFFGQGDLNKSIQAIGNINYILRTESLKRDVNKMLKDLNLKPTFNIYSNSTSKRQLTNKELQVIKNIRKKDYQMLRAL